LKHFRVSASNIALKAAKYPQLW